MEDSQGATPYGLSISPDGSFLIAEGRASGRLSARYRAANFPRRRVDGAGFDVVLGVSEMVWEATVT